MEAQPVLRRWMRVPEVRRKRPKASRTSRPAGFRLSASAKLVVKSARREDGRSVDRGVLGGHATTCFLVLFGYGRWKGEVAHHVDVIIAIARYVRYK